MRINPKQKICLVLGGIIFALIGIELFLRSFSEYSIERYLARGSDFWDARCGLHRPSKILGYEPIPNSASRINSLGMFDKEYSLEKGKDTYRIIVLGDSITAHGQYTFLLEDRLNGNKLGYNFEVWNCGIGGHNIEQYVNYLKYKAVRYDPDMVIIGFCLNDFLSSIPVVYKSSHIKNGLIEYYNPYSRTNFLMSRVLFRYSYLYRFLMLKLEIFLSSKNPYRHMDEQRESGISSLKAIKKMTNKKGITLYAIIFPYLKPLKEYTEIERKEYDTMIEVLEMLNIDYLDLHPYFSNIDLYQLRQTPTDKIHPSVRGHEIATDIIYEYLLKQI